MSQAVVTRENKVVPKFTITELDGERTRTKKVYNTKKKTFEDKTETIRGGYHLKFPRGHDIVVDTIEEVKRLVGDPEQVEYVNLETSDVHAVAHVPLRKAGGDE